MVPASLALTWRSEVLPPRSATGRHPALRGRGRRRGRRARGWGAGDVGAVDQHPARPRRSSPEATRQQPCLAGTVGAEQGHGRPGRDPEGDAPQHGGVAVAGGPRCRAGTSATPTASVRVRRPDDVGVGHSAGVPSKMGRPKSITYRYWQTSMTRAMCAPRGGSRAGVRRSPGGSPRSASSPGSRPEDGSFQQQDAELAGHRPGQFDEAALPGGQRADRRPARSSRPHSARASPGGVLGRLAVAGRPIRWRMDCARPTGLPAQRTVVEHGEAVEQLHPLERAAEPRCARDAGDWRRTSSLNSRIDPEWAGAARTGR